MDGIGGRRRRRISRETDDQSITKTELPAELVVTDILTRLPMKTLVRCRCVSKYWLNLLLHPSFAKAYFPRSPLAHFLIQTYSPVSFLLVEFDQDSIVTRNGGRIFVVSPKSLSDFKTFTKTPLGSCCVQILNSCNGVLCFIMKSTLPIPSVSRKSQIGGWYPFHIYNPVTSEHLVVPQMETNSSLFPYAGVLGYSGKTNDFKLLRFLQIENNQGHELAQQEADIITFGSDTWRRIEISTSRRLKFSSSAPFLNVALHWITYGDDELICSFDFEEEEFQSLPTPAHFDGIDRKGTESEIGTLGGCLCLCFRHSSGCPIDVWVMNEYGVKESWSKLYVVDNLIHSSIRGTVKLVDNGDILLMGRYGLYLCDQKGKVIMFVGYDITNGIADQIPHVPSFTRVLKQD